MGGLLAVALAGEHALGPMERATLTAARDLSGAQIEIDEVQALTPAELGQRFPPDPGLRSQLVSAMVLMSMADEQPSMAQSALVSDFARELGVDNPLVDSLRHLAKGQLTLARLDIARRFWARDRMVKKVRDEGFTGLYSIVQSLRRQHQDPELTARYRALGKLPEGTLGREYFEMIVANEFSFPGELGSAPEFVTFHDITHVLGGYGTSPSEELLIGFFSAGFRRENPLTFLLLVMCQHHMGIETIPHQPRARGRFDPARAIAALQHGAAMNTDISGNDFEYWPLMDQPVSELRERFGIAHREPRTDDHWPA